jgi:hypothetical protein
MRDRMFTIRLTESERLRLDMSARELDMKPAQYLRAVINGEIVSKPSPQQIAKSVRKAFKDLV